MKVLRVAHNVQLVVVIEELLRHPKSILASDRRETIHPWRYKVSNVTAFVG